jgi:predicted dehydrogenase
MPALRVALAGAGNIAALHLPAYVQFPEQVELVAVCDVDERLARTRARDAGVERVFTDFDAMLREVACDAVDICTPHDLHAPLAHAAIEAGRHVLVEKPFALSLDECRSLVSSAGRAGVTLMVAQNQRFLPAHQGTRVVVAAGRLGAIRAVRSDSIQCWPALVPAGHWQYDGARAGGGVLINVAVHRIDLLRYLVGEVRRVSSAVCRTTHPNFVNGAEDYAAATLEFENGALGQLFATCSAFRAPWCEQFMLFGEAGAIHAVPPLGHMRGPAFAATSSRSAPVSEWLDQFAGFEPVDAEAEGLPSESGQVNEILHFADCCRTGAEPLSSGRDNVETMKIAFGIYEAARTGQPVELAAL